MNAIGEIMRRRHCLNEKRTDRDGGWGRRRRVVGRRNHHGQEVVNENEKMDFFRGGVS